MIGAVSFKENGEEEHINFVSGWDSSTGWYTEQGLASDGTQYSIKWKRVSPTVDEGKQVGLCFGKPMPETDRIERKGNDEFVVTGIERKKGEAKLPDATFVFHRVARDKTKRGTPQ